jgi:hypothetical protein
MNDVAVIEDTISWLSSFLPTVDDMPKLLADNEFYRGRIAQVYTLISALEYKLERVNEDEV